MGLLRKCGRAEGGQALILAMFAVIVVCGFVAMSIDVGCLS